MYININSRDLQNSKHMHPHAIKWASATQSYVALRQFVRVFGFILQLFCAFDLCQANLFSILFFQNPISPTLISQQINYSIFFFLFHNSNNINSNSFLKIFSLPNLCFALFFLFYWSICIMLILGFKHIFGNQKVKYFCEFL